MSSDEAKRRMKIFYEIQFNLWEKSHNDCICIQNSPELIESFPSKNRYRTIRQKYDFNLCLFHSFSSESLKRSAIAIAVSPHKTWIRKGFIVVSNRISLELCMDVSNYNERNMIWKMPLFSMRIIYNATDNVSDKFDMIGFVWNFLISTEHFAELARVLLKSTKLKSESHSKQIDFSFTLKVSLIIRRRQ